MDLYVGPFQELLEGINVVRNASMGETEEGQEATGQMRNVKRIRLERDEDARADSCIYKDMKLRGIYNTGLAGRNRWSRTMREQTGLDERQVPMYIYSASLSWQKMCFVS